MLILFICHAFGDYYLQTGTLAKKKENDYAYIAIHCAVYAVPFAIISVVMCIINDRDVAVNAALASVIAVVAHFLIDTCKYYIQKENVKFATIIYLVDQLLHWITLILLGKFFVAESLQRFSDMDFGGATISWRTWVILLVYMLFMLQPSYITYIVTVKRHFKIEAVTCIGDEKKLYMIIASFIAILGFFFTKLLVIITFLYFIITVVIKRSKTGRTLLTYEPYGMIGYIFAAGIVIKEFLMLVMI